MLWGETRHFSRRTYTNWFCTLSLIDEWKDHQSENTFLFVVTSYAKYTRKTPHLPLPPPVAELQTLRNWASFFEKPGVISECTHNSSVAHPGGAGILVCSVFQKRWLYKVSFPPQDSIMSVKSLYCVCVHVCAFAMKKKTYKINVFKIWYMNPTIGHFRKAKVNGGQKLCGEGRMKRQSPEDIQWNYSVWYLMADTRPHMFVQTHRMYDTTSEP